MISFNVKGGLTESTKFLKSLKLFSIGNSLGGVESLIQNTASIASAFNNVPNVM